MLIFYHLLSKKIIWHSLQSVGKNFKKESDFSYSFVQYFTRKMANGRQLFTVQLIILSSISEHSWIRARKCIYVPFDSQNAALTGLPQPAGIQSSRKPRMSEIWGYKRWLAIYQNITLIQLFKQRCIRQNSCLGPVGDQLTQTSRPWQKEAMGLYIISLNICNHN